MKFDNPVHIRTKIKTDTKAEGRETPLIETHSKKTRLDELTEMMAAMAKLDFSNRAIVGDEGDLLDFIATGLNLMSEQLKKAFSAKDLYSKIFNVTNDFIFLTDADGTITDANPSTLELTGYDSEEIAQYPISRFFPDLQKNLPESASSQHQAIVMATLDAGLPVSLSYSSLTADDGELLGRVFIARAIAGLPKKAASNNVNKLYYHAVDILRKMKFWKEWLDTQEFTALNYQPREVLIFEQFIRSEGEVNPISEIFGITPPRVLQVLSKTIRKLQLNQTDYNKWEQQNKHIFSVSRQDLDNMRDQVIFRFARNLFNNRSELSDAAYQHFNLTGNLEDYELSQRLLKVLNNLDCYTVQDMIHQFPDPLKDIPEKKKLSVKLKNELQLFIDRLLT